MLQVLIDRFGHERSCKFTDLRIAARVLMWDVIESRIAVKALTLDNQPVPTIWSSAPAWHAAGRITAPILAHVATPCEHGKLCSPDAIDRALNIPLPRAAAGHF